MTGLFAKLDIELDRLPVGRAVENDGVITAFGIGKDGTAVAEHVGTEIECDGGAVTTLHHAVDARWVMQFSRIGQKLGPGLGKLEAMFLVKVGAVVKHLDVAVDRQAHQNSGLRIEGVFLGVPEDGVVIGDDFLIEFEAGIDLVNRGEKATVI